MYSSLCTVAHVYVAVLGIFAAVICLIFPGDVSVRSAHWSQSREAGGLTENKFTVKLLSQRHVFIHSIDILRTSIDSHGNTGQSASSFSSIRNRSSLLLFVNILLDNSIFQGTVSK